MPQDALSPSCSPQSWSFEPTGRLVHLRWAVAEIGIGIETPSAGLDAAERALRLFSQRATTLIQTLESDSELLADACYTAQLAVGEARSCLTASAPLRVERARALHAARRRLHRALIIVAEAMAREAGTRSAAVSSFDSPELVSLLVLRRMFSAFRGGLISAGEERARLSWALDVASAELSVLLASPMLADLPPNAQQTVADLAKQLSAWAAREADPMLGRALYRQVSMIPAIANDLSTHPLLVEHDERALSELAALLAHEPDAGLLEAQVLGHLCALRGLDAELDRLELTLIYGAPGALGALCVRVADLRARLSRPVRGAVCWS